MNFLDFRETWRRVESSHLLATSSHVRSRQPGNTKVWLARLRENVLLHVQTGSEWTRGLEVTSKRVNCTRLHVFVFPGNVQNWKLKLSNPPPPPPPPPGYGPAILSSVPCTWRHIPVAIHVANTRWPENCIGYRLVDSCYYNYFELWKKPIQPRS